MASSVTASSLLGPSFQAGGIASTLDTTGIIDKLVSIEGAPLTQYANQTATLGVQISAIGTLKSGLTALQTAADNLSSGLTVISASGDYSDFNITGNAAYTGRYTLKVQDLARAAKARSTAVYTSADDVVNVAAGSLQVNVDGVPQTIAVAANTTLGNLATQINNAGKAFTAAVVSDGTHFFLTLTNKNTGYAIGNPDPTTAMTVVSDVGLGLTSPPDLQAKNAVIFADNLRIERKTNTITDVIPGATLSLKGASNTDTDVVFANDSAGTSAKLQTFVDAYNTVAKFLATQLAPPPDGTKSDQLLSGSIALAVQRRLGDFISTEINPTGTIRTLRDLGVREQKDGTVTLNSFILDNAVAVDPAAVNTIFSKATTGISASIDAYIKQQTDSATGVLTTRVDSLNASIAQIKVRSDDEQRHLDAYRAQLTAQYSAMESIVANFKSIGDYLTAQDSAKK